MSQQGLDPKCEPSITCKYCHSSNYIKKGRRKTKNRGLIQRFFCKDCLKTFCVDNGFDHMRNSEYGIIQAIDTYFEGLSSRKCARNLKKFSGIRISHVSILDWVRKYSALVSNFVNQFIPNLGYEQITDETTIKTEGENHQFGIVLDKDSRYIIRTKYWDKKGSELSPKDIASLWKMIKQLKKRGKWKTDGHVSYKQAFNKVFYSRYKENQIEWERNVTSKTGKYNSRIERVNRNLKDRLRTIYGFKARWSAPIILQGWVTYYNFIRSHIGIDNQTPAQRAGIDLDLGENNWLMLIRKAAMI